MHTSALGLCDSLRLFIFIKCSRAILCPQKLLHSQNLLVLTVKRLLKFFQVLVLKAADNTIWSLHSACTSHIGKQPVQNRLAGC